MPCGGPKQYPFAGYNFIISVWSIEISKDILRNQKRIIGQAVLNICGPI